jgi:hypothetical protein
MLLVCVFVGLRATLSMCEKYNDFREVCHEMYANGGHLNPQILNFLRTYK